MNENAFDSDFLSDIEMEEMLDSFIELIRDDIEKDENRLSIINPLRVGQLLDSYKLLRNLLKDTEAVVTWNLYEPFKSMGAVRVNGPEMVFLNSSLFAKAIEAASNVEIYPKTDGTVQMNLTFHGLMQAVAFDKQ